MTLRQQMLSELDNLERIRLITTGMHRVSIEDLMRDVLTRFGLTDDEEHEYCVLFDI